MISDEYKLTRKRYKDELRAKVSSSDLRRIRAHEVAIVNLFNHQMISFAEDTKDWPVLVSQISTDLTDLWKMVRIFALQALYGNPREPKPLPLITSSPSPLSKRLSPSSSSESRSAKKSKPIIRIRASDEEATLSSGPSESEEDATGLRNSARDSTPSSVQRVSFIQTSLCASKHEGEVVAFQPPSPSSVFLQQVRTSIPDSLEERTIVIKRCACGNADGTSSECKCRSREGVYLVPRKILRSRRARLGEEQYLNATELLVEWNVFEGSGAEHPPSWVPMEPLHLWRSGVLMDYLVGRISYPK